MLVARSLRVTLFVRQHLPESKIYRDAMRRLRSDETGHHAWIEGAGAFEVEGEEVAQDILVAQVVRPAVSVEHGVVEPIVGEGEPGGASVIEAREGALLQFTLA